MAGLLMGNYAESGRKGNWGTAILDAITQRLGNSSGSTVQWATGCADIDCKSGDGIAAAVALASQPTVSTIIVTLGLGFNGISGSRADGGADESEGHDRISIELPGQQAALVSAIRAANPTKCIVGLLVHGGTLALGKAGDDLDAILSAWYPGIEGGHAIAQTLFGDYSPAGRSASTWYASTSVLPPQDTQMDESAGTGITYRYFKDWQKSVVYPFGHGLSYSTFSYSALSASSSSIAACAKLTLSVTITNAGKVDSDEVVQVYAKLPSSTVPVRSTARAGSAR